MAYDRKQFAVAIHMLGDEFERTDFPELKARKAYLIAESYNEINNVTDAIDWYKMAFDLGFGDKALERLAYALKKNEQYIEAVRVFQAVQKRVGQDPRIIKEITECTNASQWLAEKDKSPFEVEEIEHNSEYSDYAPQIYEGSQLVFSSDRKSKLNENIYGYTGNWFSDIYIINQFSNSVIPFDDRINSEHNDGTAAFNSTYTEMIFTRCVNEFDDDHCMLMSSTRDGGSWTEPKALEFIEEGINYGDPAFHTNDSILFFNAEMEEGFGGKDIYYAQRIGESWSVPQILGAGVNTSGNERFPFIDKDTLYFASDGWPGMGGLDVFKTYVDEDGDWSKVENLKPPINSGSDDFGLVIDLKRRANTGELTGYFSSSRDKGASDDIYAFRSRIVADPNEVIEDVVKDEKELKLKLAVTTSENTFLVPDDPQSGVTGKVSLPQVELVVETTSGKRKINSGEKGLTIQDIQPEEVVKITAAKEGYFTEIKTFKPSNVPEYGEKTYSLPILMEKIVADREIVLENIYYDLDEFFIRDDAKPSLNELGTLLINNPKISIQLFSHTDCRGRDDYNLTLSQNRAQAAVDYLVDFGIDASRMGATGLGETRPAINCYCETCTEEEHQENRRTTFKIVSY